MPKLLLDIPSRLETERLYLRCYRASDGPWYYEMSQRNKSHLARYESGNPVMTIDTEKDAEVAVRNFAAAWTARDAFFLGVFRRDTREFVAQIYVGPVDWDLPEFEIGFFVDAEHEGQGYVTEAARAALGFAFEHLGAHRVRLECDDTNERSFRVAERCGMVREGHMRENKRNADGSISGTLHYGILRDEFMGHPETWGRFYQRGREMEQSVNTHCRNCGEQQLHEIYLGSNGYVHSVCTVCGKDVSSATPVDEVAGGGMRACAREKTERYHVKYLGTSGYIHWFCATCGNDVRSASPVRAG